MKVRSKTFTYISTLLSILMIIIITISMITASNADNETIGVTTFVLTEVPSATPISTNQIESTPTPEVLSETTPSITTIAPPNSILKYLPATTPTSIPTIALPTTATTSPTADFSPEMVDNLTPTPSISPTATPSNKSEIRLKIGSNSMIVNGKDMNIDPDPGTVPVIVNGRTLLPIRAIVEAMGGTIAWNDVDKKISVVVGSNKIELWIDKTTTTVNGIEKSIEVSPKIINKRTMIPIRYVIENLNCQVNWDSETKSITINY